MAADLKAGRESFRKELREEYNKRCHEQEKHFIGKNSELEAAKRELDQNLQRVRRERSDERRVRKRAAEKVMHVQRELDSLRAQVAPVVERVEEQ